MKFNWGHGIALAYGVFALTLVAVVIKTTQYNHSLVTEEYYAKDLQYQTHYEKLANSKTLKNGVKVWKDDATHSLAIQFPEDLENIKGEVTFYRPANSEDDFSVPFELDSGRLLEYPTGEMRTGLWTIKIDWQAGTTPYFEEVYIDI